MQTGLPMLTAGMKTDIQAICSNTSRQGWVIHHPSFSSYAVGMWKVAACWWVSFWIGGHRGAGVGGQNSLHHSGTL